MPLQLVLHHGTTSLLTTSFLPGRGRQGQAQQLSQPLVTPHRVEDLGAAEAAALLALEPPQGLCG